MQRYFGTIVRGVRTPIVKEGDNLIEIVYDSVTNAIESENISINDKDIIAITESLVARCQGNYATIDQIAKDINEKYSSDIGIIFPILSRNRFSIILKALAKTGKKLHILLSYPADEMGNHLMDERELYKKNINYSQVLSEVEYRELFGNEVKHQFTGIDYVDFYKKIGGNCEIHFSNDPTTILNFTKDALVCSIHTRDRVKQELKDAGAQTVYCLDDILNKSVDGSGYNENYGLLGSNLSSDESIKLFPRDTQKFVDELQQKFNSYSKKEVEVMIYGDGAFKDPVGKIWELADPVVSPAYTKGLSGTPNEIKIKYIADTELKDSDENREKLIAEKILNKDKNLTGKNETLGTTPRQLTDLIGSLCDLTSGSGDKGTPVIFIQGYFDNFASE